MPIDITRRDFINGAVIGAGGLLLPDAAMKSQQRYRLRRVPLGYLTPQTPLRITPPH